MRPDERLRAVAKDESYGTGECPGLVGLAGLIVRPREIKFSPIGHDCEQPVAHTKGTPREGANVGTGK